MTTRTQVEITGPQAKALAALLHELRPDWDERGLLAAIHGARQRAGNFQLAIAAIRAAATPSVRTPAVIGMDGPHWHPEQAPPPPRRQHVQAPNRCPNCRGWHAPDPTGALCDPPEHQRSHGRGAAQAKAALRQALTGGDHA